MALIRSNSALVAFDGSIFSKYEDFIFLDYIQSFEIDVTSKRVNDKFLGEVYKPKKQFVKPQVVLNMNFLQTNNMSNELLFGFTKILKETSLVTFVDTLNPVSYQGALKEPFFNKSAFVIFDEFGNNDLIAKIINNNFNQNMITVSLGNLYINSYSFNYRINQIPVVSCSFLCSDFNLAKLQYLNSFYYLNNWNGSSIKLSPSSIENLKTSSDYPREKLVYLMKDFKFENTFASTTTPGPNISNFLDGLVQSLDISINFDRGEFYFFNGTNDVSSRKMSSPKLNLTIDGISNKFEIGNINSFFNADQSFSCSILMGDTASENQNVTKLLFDKLFVDGFSYSIDTNGFLNYKIQCSCDINRFEGFRILEINKADPNVVVFKSSDNYDFITFDLKTLISKRI